MSFAKKFDIKPWNGQPGNPFNNAWKAFTLELAGREPRQSQGTP